MWKTLCGKRTKGLEYERNRKEKVSSRACFCFPSATNVSLCDSVSPRSFVDAITADLQTCASVAAVGFGQEAPPLWYVGKVTHCTNRKTARANLESPAVVRILTGVMCWGVNAGSGVKRNSAPHPVVLWVRAPCALPFFSVTAGESRGVADSRGESGKERCHCCCQNAAFGHQYARCYHSEVRAPRYSHKQSKYVQRGRRPKDRVSVLTLPVVSLSFARFWASDGTFNNTWL